MMSCPEFKPGNFLSLFHARCSKPEYPLPDSYITSFLVTGYNYKRPLMWRGYNGQDITPIQNEFFHNYLTSRWVFEKAHNGNLDVWYFVTLEDIHPVVYDEVTGKLCQVRRADREGGFTLWEVKH